MDDLIMFPLSPQSYPIALFKSARFTLHRKFFPNHLLRQRNHGNKIDCCIIPQKHLKQLYSNAAI